LAKLTGLVRQTSGGKYTLTDDGKEAVRVLTVVAKEVPQQSNP
jgi:hypothetical protein